MRVENPPVTTNESAGKIGPSPQLVKAANEFEANFLGELLKPLREDPLFGDGSGLGGDSLGSDGPGGAMGTIGNLASEALAQAIAKQGGLGIARDVLSELGPVEAAKAQQKGASLGPECGACATPLTMGDPENISIGVSQMLGQGNMSERQPVSDLKEIPEHSMHADSGRFSKSLGPTRAVRAVGGRRN